MLSSRAAELLSSLTAAEKHELLRELQSQRVGLDAQDDPDAASRSTAPGGLDLLWLLDQLPSMVAYWDVEQRCRYANGAYLHWFGASRTRMANITLSELLGPLYELNRPFIDGALRGTPQRFERTIRDPFGGPSRHSLAHYIPDVQDGVVKGFVALVHDVTEIHELGEDLQESAAEITSLFELLPVGVSTLDAEGNVLTMNKALESILGLTMSEIKRGDSRVRSYVHTDGRALTPNEFPSHQAIKEQRPAGPTEIGFQNDDGAMVWVSVSAVPIVSKRSACIVVTRDITRERSLQSSLAQSNERFAAILDGMPVPLAINDEAGNITYLNPAFTERFGYTTDDIPNLEAWWPRGYPNVAYRKRVATDWAARLDRAKREGVPFEPVELEVATKSGATRIVIGSATAIVGSYKGEHLVVLFDVTEKTRAEGFLRSVLNSAMDGIITIDEEQRIVGFNTGAERMFKCAATTAIGGPLDRFIPENARKKHASEVHAFGEQGLSARTMAASSPRSPMERSRVVYGCRTDGEQFPLAASISHVRIGEQLYFTAVCRDTTDQLRAEKAREQLEAQLRHLQKTETIGSFAGGIAHDFNNILSSIMGLTSMALVSTSSDPELKESLTAILEATKRGAQLSRQLLSLSRPSAVEFRPVLLESVVREVSKLMRSALPHNVQIEVNTGKGLQPVLADSGQVHQVLLNLCSNSAHAMRQNGGKLGISLEMWRGVLAPGLAERDYVRMSVSDTGHGIPREVLPKIFDPFFTTKKLGEGTGLGLAVVRTIVEAHAGAITAESEVGGPTTFQVFWPTVDVATVPAVAIPKQRSAHVLFLDDDAMACRVGERILRGNGYVVTAFTDPEEAWTAISASPTTFEVVVTDLSMPKLTGLELAERMLARGIVLPIVLCTGNPGTLSAPTLLSAGIQELVLKPTAARELLDAVARALAKRRFVNASTQAAHSA